MAINRFLNLKYFQEQRKKNISEKEIIDKILLIPASLYKFSYFFKYFVFYIKQFFFTFFISVKKNKKI